MIDVGSIAAGLAALKSAWDIAGSLTSLRGKAEFQNAVLELQSKILSAQADQSALLERVRHLEAEKAKLDLWEVEKKRYQLTDFGGQTFAYDLKLEMSNGEPPHRICPTCFQQDLKSILQFKCVVSTKQDRYDCGTCKTLFLLGERHPFPKKPAKRTYSGW